MPSALPPEAAGLLALLALALLPGLLVVRAPWTAVPALSVAFWVLGWWWFPLASRGRGLQFALVGFTLLAALRALPRHQVPPPPGHTGPTPPLVTGPMTGHVPRLRSVSALVVTGVALALAVPLPLWPHLPGREMAFHTTSARVAIWRDALPSTYEPLLPVAPFGAHAPALPTLAADVSLVSGLDPSRSVVVAAQLCAALLLLGLFALLSVRLRPASAALAALLGLAAAPWPGFLTVWGEGGPTLALALSLSAAALLFGHASRPSAAAAGMLLGAALLAQPLLAVVVVAGVGGGASWRARTMDEAPQSGESSRAPRVRCTARRLVLACGVAVVLASPALARLARALSRAEVSETLGSLSGTDVAHFVTGVGLLGLALLLTHWLTASRPRLPLLSAALVGVSALALLVRVHLGPAGGQLEPAVHAALSALEGEGGPLEAVCAPPKLIDWVPALAGRVSGDSGRERAGPWVPHPLREEWHRAPRRGCSTILDPAPRKKSQSLTSDSGTPGVHRRSSH